jgi:hypothetical protein
MMSFFSSRQIGLLGVFSAFFLLFAISITSLHAQDADFCAALLSEHPNGGAGLKTEVLNLVAAAPEVVEDVLKCAGSANKAQAQALGAGLAEVVEGLKETNPEQADRIAALVAGSESEVLKTAYAGGDSDEATAAIPGDGEGGGDAAPAGDAPATFGGGPAAPTLIVGSSGGGTGGGTVSPN